MTKQLSVAVLLAAAALAPAAFACPQTLPPGLQAESVGEQMVVNGLPMQIRQVTAKGTPEEVLERVERAWKDEGHEVKHHRAGEWQVISAHTPECLATLQLMARQGSFGYFGIGEPTREQAWLPKRLGIKLPGNIQLGSSVDSTDSGRKGLTVSFSTKRTVEDIDAYFMRHLNALGWQAVSSHELRGERRARVLSGQKGRERIQLVLWNDGLTRALLNLSEMP